MCVNAACNHVDEIDPWDWFHQHVYMQLLLSQIPQMQKDSQVISVVLQLWDLSGQKQLVKRWWNQPLNSYDAIVTMK